MWEVIELIVGLLHERYNQAQGKDETSLKKFDQYLKQQSGVVLKTWVHKNKKGNTTYETLSTFVRNKIDHPEAKSPTGKVYEFSEEEMNRSIDFLYSLLYNKKTKSYFKLGVNTLLSKKVAKITLNSNKEETKKIF